MLELTPDPLAATGGVLVSTGGQSRAQAPLHLLVVALSALKE
jgi:hypothetical protein